MALGQIGTAACKTRRSVALLPTTSELPGDGWTVLAQRTWRTGRLGPRFEAGNRAAAAGSVTAWRSFENAARTRWLWVQIIPMASEVDAQIALEKSSESGMRNRRAEVTLVEELEVPSPSIPGIGARWALEHHVSSPNGERVNLLMGGSVGRVVFRLQASGWIDWSWDEVGAVAEVVVARIGAAELNGS
jgi:hypothetical protein